MKVESFLESVYKKALAKASSISSIEEYASIYTFLKPIISRAEYCKGVLTVVITSLVYKIHHPEQDIRNHQVGIQGGYFGRSFDSKYITPFLQSNGWPAMKESGWLTRSLEQKVPYNRIIQVQSLRWK